MTDGFISAVVYIGSLPRWHQEHTLMMLDGGKHVLCEVPITLNSKHAEEVFAKAKEKNVFLMEV